MLLLGIDELLDEAPGDVDYSLDTNTSDNVDTSGTTPSEIESIDDNLESDDIEDETPPNENQEEDNQENEDETPPDEEETDYGLDSEDEDGSNDLDTEDNSSDTDSSDETDKVDANNVTKDSLNLLLSNFIELYTDINILLEKFRSIDLIRNTNIDSNEFNDILNSINSIRESVYEYTTIKFRKSSYYKNLEFLTKCKEYLKINLSNIEILLQQRDKD